MDASNKPTHSLDEAKRLIEAHCWMPTFSATDGMFALGLEKADMRDCLLGLTPDDFYKTMPAESEKHAGRMQDVYLPVFCARSIYLKIQIVTLRNGAGELVVISFKKDESAEYRSKRK